MISCDGGARLRVERFVCFLFRCKRPRRAGAGGDGARVGGALEATCCSSRVCSYHRLTVAWLVRAQKEARQTMELLKTLPLDVYHELLDAVLE